MQSWRVLCVVLMLWRCSICFQLHDILRDLQTENAYLHSKVENMTEMLMEMKFYIWNNSRGQAPAPEHLQESSFCKQDIIWSGSSNVNYPVPILIVTTQALLSLLST
ncbi:hypothetical protein GDO81_014514 [Engystomops pustulosus]|uniref:Uncharacterized protein n=1 Tax=Engystomops pustulosus TaxID=76066 RepID=A0AAV7BAP8_ENGPU|nr:hypothetical protein GDO81_014514 [Engystomops pustulosus]